MTCAISFVAPVLARLRLILSSKDKEILGREWKTAVQSAPVHPHFEVSQRHEYETGCKICKDH